MDSSGKLVMESILETQAATILEFFAGLRGTFWVTFEEGAWAAWLYDLLKPRVAKLVVCNPRKNALLDEGNRGDRVDARKLGESIAHQPAQAGLPWREWCAEVVGVVAQHRIAHGAAGRAKMLSISPATFVAPERGVSHDSGNATVRISIQREDRDRDRSVHYCSHCRLDTEAVGSLSSE
jgi:hypothetical protein